MKKSKKTLLLVLIIFTVVAIVTGILKFYKVKEIKKFALSSELRKSMTYDVVEDGQEQTNVSNVKFNVFFLKDINQDGYAEKINGTCLEIGNESTLYMELTVENDGYIEEGTININANNFYFQAAIPKDNQVAENAIGANIKTIKLQNVQNGTNKLLIGLVHSGDYTYRANQDKVIDNINIAK